MIFQMEKFQPIDANELTVQVTNPHCIAFNYFLNLSVKFNSTLTLHKIIRTIVRCQKDFAEFHVSTGISKTLLY
jgi:hypothetical protein